MGFGNYFKTYRLQSEQRIRSGVLYYLDHPVIGVLVLASKYEPPEPPKPAPAETVPVTPSPTEPSVKPAALEDKGSAQ